MTLQEILGPHGIMPQVKASSKKQLLQEMAERMAGEADVDARKTLDTILERERLGTTGVGRGVAIPHGRLPGLKTIHGVFARLDRAVDFDAVDDKPVDLVFMLLAPEEAGADHLKILARVSRLLRNEQICEKLRGAQSADAIKALLIEEAPLQSSAA